jgi:hypothetical protein
MAGGWGVIRGPGGDVRRLWKYGVTAMLAFTHQTSVTIAQVAFLLILFSGIWFVAAEIPRLRLSKTRRIVAGTALAVAGLLLIIASYWGNFG